MRDGSVECDGATNPGASRRLVWFSTLQNLSSLISRRLSTSGPPLLAYLLVAAALGACGIEPLDASEARLSAGPGDCTGCHGRRTPEDPLASILGDIADTHFDDWHIDADGAFVTDPTEPLEGYMLEQPLAWAPPGQGYVLRDGPASCGGSCHDGHNQDLTIARQWFQSNHASVNSAPFTHTFTSGVCMRCHSGAGFANYVSADNIGYPGWTPPSDEFFPHHLTCNACHDGIAYPSSREPRLRIDGVVAMVSGSGATATVDASLEVGTSAVCVTCHQARESGASLAKKIFGAGADPGDGVDTLLTGFSFVNPHYRAAGAMLFGVKGFEQPTLSYSPGNLFHQGQRCVGCHMAPSDDPGLGGHSLTMSRDGVDFVAPCQRCHGNVQSFDDIGLRRDLDCDGVAGGRDAEIEGLEHLIIAALEAEGIYYDGARYPYFYDSPDLRDRANWVRTWRESQIAAAFNLKLISAEPGAAVHNLRYAAQLLRDSYEAMTGVTLSCARPQTDADHPATVYTP